MLYINICLTCCKAISQLFSHFDTNLKCFMVGKIRTVNMKISKIKSVYLYIRIRLFPIRF